MNKITTAQVVQAIATHGPISTHELSVLLNTSIQEVSARATRRRKLHNIYIADWSREEGSTTTRLQALYAVGTGKRDKPKPAPMTKKERNQRYRARQRTASVNSVFALGQRVNDRRPVVRLGSITRSKRPHAQVQSLEARLPG